MPALSTKKNKNLGSGVWGPRLFCGISDLSDRASLQVVRMALMLSSQKKRKPAELVQLAIDANPGHYELMPSADKFPTVWDKVCKCELKLHNFMATLRSHSKSRKKHEARLNAMNADLAEGQKIAPWKDLSDPESTASGSGLKVPVVRMRRMRHYFLALNSL